jgi:prenyl protein peptidase
MLKFDGYSLRGALLISPGLFGVCHLHHLINLVRARGLSIKQGMIAVCFQLFYTFLFGMFATFVFWKTGSLLGVVLAHSLCNFLGFPDLNLFARRPGAHVVGILLFSIGIYALASDYVQLESSFDSFQ